MSILPNAAKARIDPVKLTEYCLSPTHPVGRHKANVFREALGITVLEAPLLIDLLVRGVSEHEAVLGRSDQFGQRYQVDIPVKTEVGEAVVRTAWIVGTGEDAPRLVTCYVL
jgi:hypothetical protein